MIKILTAILVTFCLVACKSPSVITPGPAVTAIAAADLANGIKGQVEMSAFGGSGAQRYRTQSGISDVATGATVSLIDVTTNLTVGSSVTSASGAFVLSFGQGFHPNPNSLYYLEAVKGLASNSAGKSVARLRTIMRFTNNTWVSITSSSLTISRSTTALSTITSLLTLSGASVTPSALIGSVLYGTPDATYPTCDTFNPGASGINKSDYAAVVGMVTDALTADQDPLAAVQYNATTHTFSRLSSSFGITALSPASGPVGAVVTISGTNFDPTPANNIVSFNGVQATVQSASTTALVVTVPAGALSGNVSVQSGTMYLAGLGFVVTSSDGHNAMDASGNLYVASETLGSVYRLAPDGTLTSFATSSSLNTPRGLTWSGSSLYVASMGNNSIVKFDQAGNASVFSTQVSAPVALMVDGTGTLYAANATTIYKLDAAGNATTLASGFQDLRGLACSGATVYAADFAQNEVFQVSSAGAVSVAATGLNQPTGLAFDTGGNLYVASQGNGALIRISASGVTSAFATITAPDGLVFSANGFFYTTTRDTHRIYRVSMSGNVEVLGEGVSSPYGLRIDGAGNTYMVNAESASLLRASSGGCFERMAKGFGYPTDLAVAQDGSTFTANYQSSNVARFTSSGAMSILASLTFPTAVAYDNPSQNLAVFGRPDSTTYTSQPFIINGGSFTPLSAPLVGRYGGGATKLLADSAGNLYAAVDSHVFKIATGSAAVTRLEASNLGSNIGGMFLESGGTLLLSLTTSNKVVRLDPSTGAATDVITSGLNNPKGIAEDASGSVYVMNAASPYGTPAVSPYLCQWTSGTVTTLWQGSGSSTTTTPYYGQDLALVNGLLYIANNLNILSYNLSSGAKAESIGYGGALSSYRNFSYLSVDPNSGTLYATSYDTNSSSTDKLVSCTTGGAIASVDYGSHYGYVTSYPLCYYSGTIYLNTGGLIDMYSLAGARLGPYASGYSSTVNGAAFTSDGKLVVPGGHVTLTKTDVAANSSVYFAGAPLPCTDSTLLGVTVRANTGDVFACSNDAIYSCGPSGGTLTRVATDSYITSVAVGADGIVYYTRCSWPALYGRPGTPGKAVNDVIRLDPGTGAATPASFWCYHPRF